MRGLLTPAVFGALLLAILSSIADYSIAYYIWFLNSPQPHISSVVVHGAALFAALGAYLGWRKGQTGAGALGGLLTGSLAVSSAFLLAPLVGDVMVFTSWLLLWVLLAALQTHLDGRLDPAKAVARGVVAAIVGAAGFSVVLFQLYRGWPPETFPFFTHFAVWITAYLPGLYVLLKR